MNTEDLRCIAFAGNRCIAAGPLGEVARQVKESADAHPLARILVFNALTSEEVDIDCRGSVADVLGRIAAAPPAPRADASPPDAPDTPPPAVPAGPGRPRLGVVSREVSLLPRHWEWLSGQPGGASVALRKLVEHARRASGSADRIRQAQNATFKFMNAMAGNLDGFEEAARALFATDRPRFEALLAAWPADIRQHLHQLAGAAFESRADQEGQDV